MIDPASRHAWAELDAKLRNYVSRRVRASSDVDDLVQTILIRVQSGLAGLRDDQRFGPWVYQIARNAIADHHKQAARHLLPRTQEEAELGADPSEQDDVESLLASHVAMFVAMLPTPYREAVTLTELEGLTSKAAAEMLGISVPAVKSRVQRGRGHLRTLLTECCDIALDVRGGVMSCQPRPNNRVHDCSCKASR